jgi:hypothetical protein
MRAVLLPLIAHLPADRERMGLREVQKAGKSTLVAQINVASSDAESIDMDPKAPFADCDRCPVAG